MKYQQLHFVNAYRSLFKDFFKKKCFLLQYRQRLYKTVVQKRSFSIHLPPISLNRFTLISILFPFQVTCQTIIRENMQEFIKDLDELFKADKLLEGYDKVKNSKVYDNEAEFLWRKSRIFYHIAKLLRNIQEDKAHAQNLYEAFVKSYRLDFPLPLSEMIKYFNEQGLEIAKLALQVDTNNFATHKWFAILLNANLTYKGINAQVASSFDIHEHFMKALELNPSDATTYYCVGSWHYEIAKLSWTVKSLAQVISGKKYTSTYQDALTYFLKAEEIEPDFYAQNLFMIATTYNALDDRKHCLEYLQKLINSFKPKNEEDKKTIMEAKTFYQSLLLN